MATLDPLSVRNINFFIKTSTALFNLIPHLYQLPVGTSILGTISWNEPMKYFSFCTGVFTNTFLPLSQWRQRYYSSDRGSDSIMAVAAEAVLSQQQQRKRWYHNSNRDGGGSIMLALEAATVLS